jgi:hypothetical protein
VVVLATVHHGASVHVDLGAGIAVLGLLLACVALAFTVRPVTHPRWRDFVAEGCWLAAVLFGVWALALFDVLPWRGFPWTAIGAALCVIGAWYLMVQRTRTRKTAQHKHRFGFQRGSAAQDDGMKLSVGGGVFNDPGYPDRVRIQLSVTVVNKGAPSTLHSWRLHLTIGGTELEGHHIPGGEPLAGSPHWKPLDEITGTSPLPTGQVSGLLLFIVNISKERLDAQSSKPDEVFSAILSVTDARQSEWTATVDFHELMAQAHLTIPSVPQPHWTPGDPMPHKNQS